ncbi:sigma-70 family RNA polymerase sigma factor [Pseudonocardia sp. KRD-182]|uniref:sigma-70 family RNA polymerase sigma factor n=1 Tax=Pseudonocardia oceani TaxID=2792013 RepID=UPI001C49CF7A|nr:sigma-70 family RNA polymerase sigma factor [Pseudonocardia oceani]MBW0108592.1 sigma-70 family RNA polymerase sigma factor [Pseudonocardia oceani]
MPLFTERSRLSAGHPGQEKLRAELITGYLPVARHIARSHRFGSESLDDLEQVAVVGLINAVDRFDADRGPDFLAFAIPTINGEVLRHQRDRASTIRMPRRVRSLRTAVLRAADELGQSTRAVPRPSEISRYLDLDLDDVLVALDAVRRAHCLSLDEPLPGIDAAAENLRFAGAISVDDRELAMVVDRVALRPLLDALPDRERRIVLLRFFGNRTQAQIGAELGISQMHVSRLLAVSLGRLRAGLVEHHADGCT